MNAGTVPFRVAPITVALTASLGPSLVAADDLDGSKLAKNPCAVALAPHEGTDKADREIIRLQAKARDALDPTAWLEQLGWAFVAKARVSFDPGFYKLAEHWRGVSTPRSLAAPKPCWCALTC